MSFDKHRQLCSRNSDQDPERLCRPPGFLPCCFVFTCLVPQVLTATDLFFCPYNFAFLRMSYKWTHIVKPLESRFLYLALCIWDSATLSHLTIVDSLLLLGSIPLYGYTTVCLSVYLLKGICVYSFSQLWIERATINICMHVFCENILS